MFRSIIFCALLVGAANAARQIPVNPSPPPPGATSDNVPGALWSVVVPGYSPATFGAAQSAVLCAAMVNKTSSYPRQYVQCSVNSVVQTAGYNSVAAQGQMYWSDFTGSTATDATARTTSRDLFVNTIQQNPDNLVPAVFPGANINDTCAANWVPSTSPPTTFSGTYTVNGMPLTKCRMAVRGSTAETTAGCTTDGNSDVCLTTIPSSTVGAYGMDNGKVCPLGAAFIFPATQAAPISIVPGTSAISIASGTATGLVQPVEFTTRITGFDLSVGDISDGNTIVRIGGLPTSIVSSVTGCDAQDVVDTLALPQTVTASSITGAASASGDTLTVTVDWASAGCSTVPVFTGTGLALGATAGPVTIQASWSPSCDNSIGFYNTYQFGADVNSRTLGNVCPRCGASSSNSVPFKYNGANAKSLCSNVQTSQGVYTASGPQSTEANGFAGTSCIKIGVANLGAAQPNNGRPMLDTPVPYYRSASSVYTYSFPDSSVVSGSFNANSNPVVAYDAGSQGTPSNAKFQLMAVDSEWNMPCSTPALVPSLSTTNSTTAQGVYLEGTDSAILGAGSCNTVSIWYNGGTTANGITADASSNANLKTLFNAPIIGPTPAPAPVTPAPVPVAPSPTAPTPSSPTAPTPSSPTPLVCTYRGTYEITPLYGPCNKYYIASGTKSNCAENFVHLRTKSNLGGKYDRVRWAIAATAQNGVGTPTRVVAEARSGVGACTNRNLAAPSNPIPGLKVGGSSWQWQFRPYPDSAECDHVNMISENRLDTTAFLSVPKPCKTFRYNESDGGRQRFKLIKV